MFLISFNLCYNCRNESLRSRLLHISNTDEDIKCIYLIKGISEVICRYGCFTKFNLYYDFTINVYNNKDVVTDNVSIKMIYIYIIIYLNNLLYYINKFKPKCL